jgi:membrane protein implicated in regulation of membrane protease activity
MYMAVETGVMLATFPALALLIWKLTGSIARLLYWPVWTQLAMILGLAGASLVANLLVVLRRELRARREHRERVGMEQRFPNCYVKRLASGKWFLTERTTGREYRVNQDR